MIYNTKKNSFDFVENFAIESPEKDTHLKLKSPLIKMSYNDYLIKKHNSIVKVPLPQKSHLYYEAFFQSRQLYQKQISSFMNQSKSQGGSYYFYNWISNDNLICELPQDGIPLVTMYIILGDLAKAESIVNEWQASIETQIFKTFFQAYKNIYTFVLENSELKEVFLGKKNCLSDLFRGQMSIQYHGKLLLTSNSAKQSIENEFKEINSIEQKVFCIITNFQYLRGVLQYLPSQKTSDYWKLLYIFLSNSDDQIQKGEIQDLLLNSSQFNLLDRLNYAQKLLPFEKRMRFFSQLQNKVLTYPHLSNLLLFNNVDKMKKIITNYLDMEGDLQSVAMVCLEYGIPELMGFIDMFQNILVLSCQAQKAKELEQKLYKKLGPLCLKKPHAGIREVKPFLNQLNSNLQRVEIMNWSLDDDLKKKVCYVCYRKNEMPQQLFVQCSRCRHGGHLSHLLKWFEQSRNVCPKTDCPCYCV